MKAIELFSGIGGFRIACDQHGIETVFANDMNPLSCAVYRHNFGATALVEGDIRQLVDQIPAHDLLTAGFPCQAYSSAGLRAGTADEKGRGTLFQVIAETLTRHKPKMFLLENVPNLLRLDKGIHFQAVLQALHEAGPYEIEWRVINACQVGLAQSRNRVLIAGHLDRRPGLGEPNGTPKDPVSLDQWKGSFPYWGRLDRGGLVTADRPIALPSSGKRVRDVLEYLPEGNRYDMTETTLPRLAQSKHVNRIASGIQILYNQKGGARQGYSIYGTEGLSPTLTSSTGKHYERYGIGDRFRLLTPDEYARLQGFPDGHCDWIAEGTPTPHRLRYVMYGNAVPPPIANYGLECLLK